MFPYLDFLASIEYIILNIAKAYNIFLFKTFQETVHLFSLKSETYHFSTRWDFCGVCLQAFVRRGR